MDVYITYHFHIDDPCKMVDIRIRLAPHIFRRFCIRVDILLYNEIGRYQKWTFSVK